MEAIEAAIAADGGNTYREHMQKLMLAAEEPFLQKKDDFRSHLGYSTAGQECELAMWHQWHWTSKKKISGRIQRLFNRGHLEEPRMVAALLTIGCQVWAQDEQGNQFRVSDFGGHAGSAIDGVALGVPDAPAHPLLTEFKTHGDKSFKKLKKEGVRESKFVHFVQMQIYMKKMHLFGALYMATNKNDDEIYCELIEYDPDIASQYIERCGKIIFAKNAPTNKVPYAGPGNSFCKNMCDFYEVCQLKEEPSVNCRTCLHSIAQQDGSWFCDNYGIILTKEAQLLGCQSWNKRPDYK